jgi:hypothetical protein
VSRPSSAQKIFRHSTRESSTKGSFADRKVVSLYKLPSSHRYNVCVRLCQSVGPIQKFKIKENSQRSTQEKTSRRHRQIPRGDCFFRQSLPCENTCKAACRRHCQRFKGKQLQWPGKESAIYYILCGIGSTTSTTESINTHTSHPDLVADEWH